MNQDVCELVLNSLLDSFSYWGHQVIHLFANGRKLKDIVSILDTLTRKENFCRRHHRSWIFLRMYVKNGDFTNGEKEGSNFWL